MFLQAVLNRKMSKKTAKKYAERQKGSEVDKPLLDQFQTGKKKSAMAILGELRLLPLTL